MSDKGLQTSPSLLPRRRRREEEYYCTETWQRYRPPSPVPPFRRVEPLRRETVRQARPLEPVRNPPCRGMSLPRAWPVPTHPAIETPEIVQDGDQKKYHLDIPLGGYFRPEDIKVKLKQHRMTVEAKCERKSKDGTSKECHEVSKKYTLPDFVDIRKVESILQPDGCLTIEAPWPLAPAA